MIRTVEEYRDYQIVCQKSGRAFEPVIAKGSKAEAHLVVEIQNGVVPTSAIEFDPLTSAEIVLHAMNKWSVLHERWPGVPLRQLMMNTECPEAAKAASEIRNEFIVHGATTVDLVVKHETESKRIVRTWLDANVNQGDDALVKDLWTEVRLVISHAIRLERANEG